MSNQYQSNSQSVSKRTEGSDKALATPLGVVLEHLRRMETHDFTGARLLLSSDFQFTGATPAPVERDAYVQLHRELLAGLPDWSYNFKVEKDDGNIIRGTVAITGKHTGTLAPTFMPRNCPSCRHW